MRSYPDLRPVATEVVGGIQGLIRLLRQVASKSDDAQFKALLEDYANVINDRAMQVKIIISVKAGQSQQNDSFDQVHISHPLTSLYLRSLLLSLFNRL